MNVDGLTTGIAGFLQTETQRMPPDKQSNLDLPTTSHAFSTRPAHFLLDRSIAAQKKYASRSRTVQIRLGGPHPVANNAEDVIRNLAFEALSCPPVYRQQWEARCEAIEPLLSRFASAQVGQQTSSGRFGVFPITGDPPTWGHLAVAFNAVLQLKLERLYIYTIDRPKKDALSSSTEARFGLLRAAVAPFRPLIEFIPVRNARERRGNLVLGLMGELAAAGRFTKGYYICSDEYRHEFPSLFADKLKQAPKKPAFSFRLAFSARELEADVLKAHLDNIHGAVDFPIEAINVDKRLQGMSSRLFRRDPTLPVVPYHVRLEMWRGALSRVH